MSEPGERRLDSGAPWAARASASGPWSLPRALVVAVGIGLLAALGWATLRSVFDITVGTLVVTALGGWGIGASLRRASASPILAALLALAAWLAALLLAWVVAMAILPESTRPLGDR